MVEFRLELSLLVELVVFLSSIAGHGDHGDAEAVYKWSTIDYDWPSLEAKDKAIEERYFVPLKNAINGIRLYTDRIFVTVPRFGPGVPSCLNTVVNADRRKPFLTSQTVLKPYPSWEMQQERNCSAFQLVQNIEIDPRAGIMFVIDTGGPRSTGCPAKLVIYDVKSDREIHRHVFSDEVVPRGANSLNDLVMDYIGEAVSFLYITNTAASSLIVYDIQNDNSYVFKHSSMKPEVGRSRIRVSNAIIRVPNGINGIAISKDFRFVYYSPIAGVGLYQVPTATLRNFSSNFSASVRKVGVKPSQGDGMIMSNVNSLYFSVLSQNAVVMWEMWKDIERYGSEDNVKMHTLTYEAKDPRMQWVDSLALDSLGYLWFTTSRLQLFFGNKLKNDTTNFIIWRAFVHEPCYAHFNHGAHHMAPIGGANSDCASRTGTLALMVAWAVISQVWRSM